MMSLVACGFCQKIDERHRILVLRTLEDDGSVRELYWCLDCANAVKKLNIKTRTAEK